MISVTKEIWDQVMCALVAAIDGTCNCVADKACELCLQLNAAYLAARKATNG